MFWLFDELRLELDGDDVLRALWDEAASGAKGDKWTVTDDLIMGEGCVYIPRSSAYLLEVLSVCHVTAVMRASKGLHRLRRDFHLLGAHVVVSNHVRACTICQKNKIEQLQPGGLL
jgi:hypothetical protein